ncbi:hypothetical protein ACIRBZ_12670 [Streptomyces sp. NPDC094038]|uniref:hypothetical protein n=1 Tax=Streptomyces sp. NPDC094038 TaxID=3366055 RepID=UPI003811583D
MTSHTVMEGKALRSHLRSKTPRCVSQIGILDIWTAKQGVAMCERSDEAWEQLTDAGLKFLVERAQLHKVTTYTEMNSVLARRTGLPKFDF